MIQEMFFKAPHKDILDEDGNVVVRQIPDLVCDVTDFAQVGTYLDVPVWHVISQDVVDIVKLKADPGFLGTSYEDLPPDIADEVMEVEWDTEETDPKTGQLLKVRKRAKRSTWIAAGSPTKTGEYVPHRFAGGKF